MLAEHARTAKQFWFVRNAGHVDLHRAARQEFESRILAFLTQMKMSPAEPPANAAELKKS
jgi:hypothetical protein